MSTSYTLNKESPNVRGLQKKKEYSKLIDQIRKIGKISALGLEDPCKRV